EMNLIQKGVLNWKTKFIGVGKKRNPPWTRARPCALKWSHSRLILHYFDLHDICKTKNDSKNGNAWRVNPDKRTKHCFYTVCRIANYSCKPMATKEGDTRMSFYTVRIDSAPFWVGAEAITHETVSEGEHPLLAVIAGLEALQIPSLDTVVGIQVL